MPLPSIMDSVRRRGSEQSWVATTAGLATFGPSVRRSMHDIDAKASCSSDSCSIRTLLTLTYFCLIQAPSRSSSSLRFGRRDASALMKPNSTSSLGDPSRRVLMLEEDGVQLIAARMGYANVACQITVTRAA